MFLVKGYAKNKQEGDHEAETNVLSRGSARVQPLFFVRNAE